MKKRTQKIFLLQWAFFQKLVSRFYEIGWSKRGGGGSKTYFTLPSIMYDYQWHLLKFRFNDKKLEIYQQIFRSVKILHLAENKRKFHVQFEIFKMGIWYHLLE